MAYTLHIRRLKSNPISTKEWLIAVAQTAGVRLSGAKDRKLTLPNGATMRMPSDNGEVYDLMTGKIHGG
jgi:hypothetical protein